MALAPSTQSRIPAAVLLTLSLTAGAEAQLPPGHIVVLTHTPSGPAIATLIDVDPRTGVTRVMPRFPFDGRRPLAVAVDPVDGDLLVALENPAFPIAGVVRVRFAAGVYVPLQSVGGVLGTITDVCFGPDGDLYLAWHPTTGRGGGVRRFLRSTMMPATVRDLDIATAMEVFESGATVVESRASGAVLSTLDLPSGQLSRGSVAIAALAGRRITGVHGLPTAVPSQVLTDDQGRMHVLENFSTLRTVALRPPLPAGGATAVRRDGIDAIVLGGASHPFLIRAIVLGAAAGGWTTIAGPLPGDPVDFAFAPPAGPRIARFVAPCAGGGTWVRTGLPAIGNTRFAFGVRGASPGVPALLALGVDDQRVGTGFLPLVLPGGCRLHVSAEWTVATSTDASGGATVPLPIPSSIALSDTRVFAQWVVFGRGSPGSSDGAGIQIGR